MRSQNSQFTKGNSIGIHEKLLYVEYVLHKYLATNCWIKSLSRRQRWKSSEEA